MTYYEGWSSRTFCISGKKIRVSARVRWRDGSDPWDERDRRVIRDWRWDSDEDLTAVEVRDVEDFYEQNALELHTEATEDAKKYDESGNVLV